MKKINKVVLGVAAGSLAVFSHGYSDSVKATVANYQDPSTMVAQTNALPTGKPTPTANAKPTPTYGAKPTPTYAAKPTPTYAAKPTPTYGAKPSPKPSPKPTPKPSPKVTAGVSVIFSTISNFFSGLFNK